MAHFSRHYHFDRNTLRELKQDFSYVSFWIKLHNKNDRKFKVYNILYFCIFILGMKN